MSPDMICTSVLGVATLVLIAIVPTLPDPKAGTIGEPIHELKVEPREEPVPKPAQIPQPSPELI